MAELKFNNNNFKKGTNLTVRRGTKWSHYSLPTANIPNIGVAHIKGKKVMRFCDLLYIDLSMEHDEDCRNYHGLEKAMKELYADFDTMEIVTLIYFEVQLVTVSAEKIANN